MLQTLLRLNTSVALLIATLSTANVTAAQPHTVAISDEYAHLFRSKTGDLVSSFRCPLEHADVRYELVQLPLARILYAIERGDVDIGLPFTQSDARDEYAILSQPVGMSRYLLLSNHDSGVDLNDPGKVVVFVRGFAGADRIRGTAIKQMQVSGWNQALDLLQLGRADALLTTERIYQAFDPSKVERFQAQSLGSLDVGFYVSAKSSQLLDAINEGIERCRAPG